MEALCEVFPDATLFVLVHARGSVSPVIERMPIRTSFIQHLPGAAESTTATTCPCSRPPSADST